MKEIRKVLEGTLYESSLSRVLSWMQKHDCGIVTAARDKITDKDLSERKVTNKENILRNRALKSQIALRYGVTSVEGCFIENYKTENAVEVGEHVFFVVDMHEKGDFFETLKKWGKQWNQDSILFIPRGGEKAILYGTNPNSYPGDGKSVEFKDRMFGVEGEFMTKVRGRPFVFYNKDVIEEIVYTSGYLGKMGAKETYKRIIKELEEL